MKKLNIFLSVFFIVSFVLLSQAIYIVKETERAVLLRFGEVVYADVPPGIHLKLPFILFVFGGILIFRKVSIK